MPEREQLLLTTSRFRVLEASIPGPDGSEIKKAVIRHPGAVAVLPWVDEQHICLIKNHRIAAGRPLIELPAGTLDPPEEPLAAARRELIEETGFEAGGLEQIHQFFVSPGILDEQIYLYLATRLQAGPPDRQPDESIENLVLPWHEALAMARNGEICDAKTLIGIFYYDLQRNSRGSP